MWGRRGQLRQNGTLQAENQVSVPNYSSLGYELGLLSNHAVPIKPNGRF